MMIAWDFLVTLLLWKLFCEGQSSHRAYRDDCFWTPQPLCQSNPFRELSGCPV